MLTILILGSICFLFFLITHIVIFHFRPPQRRFRTLIYLLLSSMILFIVTFWLLTITGFAAKVNSLIPENVIGVFMGLFVYFFCWYFYTHLVVVFDRSVTPRIMVEIDNGKDHKATIAQIKKNYSLEEKFRKELIDMDIMHRIKKDGNYYYNTSKGIAHGKVIEFLRVYLHIGGHQ